MTAPPALYAVGPTDEHLRFLNMYAPRCTRATPRVWRYQAPPPSYLECSTDVSRQSSRDRDIDLAVEFPLTITVGERL